MRSNTYSTPLSTVEKKWACISKQHDMFSKESIADSEASSIHLFCENNNAPWSYFQKEHGWECVQITIQIIQK